MNQICVLSIYVEDIQTALKHYVDTLGFSVDKEFTECIVRLKNDGVTLLLEQMEDNYPGRPCVIPAVQVENLTEEISRLRKLGVDLVHERPQHFPAGQFIACRDGSGNMLEILQFNK